MHMDMDPTFVYNASSWREECRIRQDTLAKSRK